MSNPLNLDMFPRAYEALFEWEAPLDSRYPAHHVQPPHRPASDIEVDATYTIGEDVGARPVVVHIQPDDSAEYRLAIYSSGPLFGENSLLSTPNPDTLLAVVEGAGFLINVRNPTDWCVVPEVHPIMSVMRTTSPSLLVITSYTHVAAIDTRGDVAWHTRRLAMGGITLGRVEQNKLHGVGDQDWNPYPFTVDLASGGTTSDFPTSIT